MPHATPNIPRCSHLQVCGHTPRPEWVQALAESADVAWRGYVRVDRSPEDAAPPQSVPDSVMMPSGEEVLLRQDSDGRSGSGDGVMFETYVQPLPAQCLSALSRAALLWGMPAEDEGWLSRYLECIFHGLQETEQRYGGGTGSSTEGDSDGGGASAANRLHFLPGELTDLLWALIMCGVRPAPAWVKTYIGASQAVLQVV